MQKNCFFISIRYELLIAKYLIILFIHNNYLLNKAIINHIVYNKMESRINNNTNVKIL